jgi:hypothetical protein
MVYLIFNTIITSSSLAIIKNRNTSFNYSVKIEVLSIAFSVFIFNLIKAVDRFFAVLSASAKSLI